MCMCHQFIPNFAFCVQANVKYSLISLTYVLPQCVCDWIGYSVMQHRLCMQALSVSIYSYCHILYIILKSKLFLNSISIICWDLLRMTKWWQHNDMYKFFSTSWSSILPWLFYNNHIPALNDVMKMGNLCIHAIFVIA